MTMYVIIGRKRRSAFRHYQWKLAATQIFTMKKPAKEWCHALQVANPEKEFTVSRATITVY